MNRVARVTLLVFALVAGVVAAAQADDGGSSGSGDGKTATTMRTTAAVPTSTLPPSTVKNGLPAVPGQVRPKTTEDDHGGATDPAETTTDDAPGGDAPALSEPALGHKLDVEPADGTVRVRRPDGQWSSLDAGATLPNDTVVDTRRGAITLTAAVDANGTKQSAKFAGAVFTFHQPSATRPVTELKLNGGDFSKCKRATPAATGARAVAAARRKPVRRLFGSGHGRFRTQGRFAAATVHGTIWVTEDFCDRTVITVKRGVVGVTDLRTGRVVSVRAGSSRTIRRR
jgi:hypothetical protein